MKPFIPVVVMLMLMVLSCRRNETKEIRRDNAVINYKLTGNGDTTLLFVHGSYMDQSCWEKQVAYFNDEYTVVTLDLPGHGKSGKERTDWSVKGFAEDVLEVIKELDLQNVILVGHSLGADINLIAATTNPGPVIGFIGIDRFKNAGMASQSPQQALAIQESLIARFSATNEKYARSALLTSKTPQVIADRVTKDYRNAYQPMAIETTPEIFEMYAVEKRLLPKLQQKLYLVNVDYAPTNEGLLKKYAVHGYEVFGMKGTCHFPMLENPDRLNELLQQVVYKIGK